MASDSVRKFAREIRYNLQKYTRLSDKGIEKVVRRFRSLVERESRKREDACGRWMYAKGQEDAKKNRKHGFFAPDSSLLLYYYKRTDKSKPRQGGR